MTKDKAKKSSGYLELIKSFLLGVLVVSMLTLVVIYIQGTHVYESIAFNNSTMKSFDKLWSIEGGATAQGLDKSRLIPEFIGYRQAGTEMLCALANGDSVSELYELLRPCILELFGSDSRCRELGYTEGRDKFTQATTQDEFIYLRYHVPILYQLIFAYSSSKLTISETDTAHASDDTTSAYISELIIVPDKEYSAAAHRYIAYAYDGEGKYFEFRLDDTVKASSFYISKLVEGSTAAEKHIFSFASDDLLPQTQPIINAELEYTPIEKNSASVTEDTVLTPLLRLFGYNPDKLNEYVDDTGANVYVDSQSRLRVGPSTLSFATSDTASGGTRGISINSLLGYTSDKSLNLFDKTIAADNFIRKLGEISPELIGGDASLCLGSVYTRDTLLVIEYILTYNNIRVFDGASLTIVLTQDTISHVELSPISVVGANHTSTCLDPVYTLRKLVELEMIPTDKKIRGLRMSYSGSNAAWSAIVK